MLSRSGQPGHVAEIAAAFAGSTSTPPTILKPGRVDDLRQNGRPDRAQRRHESPECSTCAGLYPA